MLEHIFVLVNIHLSILSPFSDFKLQLPVWRYWISLPYWHYLLCSQVKRKSKKLLSLFYCNFSRLLTRTFSSFSCWCYLGWFSDVNVSSPTYAASFICWLRGFSFSQAFSPFLSHSSFYFLRHVFPLPPASIPLRIFPLSFNFSRLFMFYSFCWIFKLGIVGSEKWIELLILG